MSLSDLFSFHIHLSDDADSTPLLCDVTVTLANGETVSASNMYTYAGDARVTGVSPSSGGTGGGTIVTITGQNFGLVTSTT